MALDLLTKEYWNEVDRLYRHDLEAFIWIRPWVLLQYEGRQLKDKLVFESWNSGNYIDAKGYFLMMRLRYKDKPKECWEWRFAYFLLEWLCYRQYARRGDPFVERPMEDPDHIMNSEVKLGRRRNSVHLFIVQCCRHSPIS
jgi:hypothetical protein